MSRKNIYGGALYSRLSRDDESIRDSLSIQNQKAMLEKYAAQNGFSNIAHFFDDGFSGGKFDRPEKADECISIPTTDWDEHTKAEKWRAAWVILIISKTKC